MRMMKVCKVLSVRSSKPSAVALVLWFLDRVGTLYIAREAITTVMTLLLLLQSKEWVFSCYANEFLETILAL